MHMHRPLRLIQKYFPMHTAAEAVVYLALFGRVRGDSFIQFLFFLFPFYCTCVCSRSQASTVHSLCGMYTLACSSGGAASPRCNITDTYALVGSQRGKRNKQNCAGLCLPGLGSLAVDGRANALAFFQLVHAHSKPGPAAILLAFFRFLLIFPCTQQARGPSQPAGFFRFLSIFACTQQARGPSQPASFFFTQ